MVGGKTAEEIDASIEKALAREAEIAEKAAAKVRAELSAQLPTPVNPATPQVESGVRPQDRRKIARLSPSEYKAKRAELLEQARKSAGIR